jgi:hypothetical protein
VSARGDLGFGEQAHPRRGKPSLRDLQSGPAALVRGELAHADYRTYPADELRLLLAEGVPLIDHSSPNPDSRRVRLWRAVGPALVFVAVMLGLHVAQGGDDAGAKDPRVTGERGTADAGIVRASLADLFAGQAAFVVEEKRDFDTDTRAGLHFLAFARDGLESFYRDPDGRYFVYYIRGKDVGLALTEEGVSFVDQGKVFAHDPDAPAERTLNSFPSVWIDNKRWYLATEAIGTPGGKYPGAVMLAESNDGRTWSNRRLILEHDAGWEAANVGTPCLVQTAKQWQLFYSGFNGTRVQIGLATGADIDRLRRANGGKPIIETSGDGIFAGQAGKRSILAEANLYYMAFEVSSAKLEDDPNFDRSNYSTAIARSTDLVQ